MRAFSFTLFFAAFFVVAGCSAGVRPTPDLGPNPMSDGGVTGDSAAACPATVEECASIPLCLFACHYDDAGALVDGGGEIDGGTDAGVDVDAGGDAGSDVDAAVDPCEHGGCTASFTFPELATMRTDIRVLATSPYWDAPGDYEEKSVTLGSVPYARHLDIDDIHFGGAFCSAPGSFRVLVNGTEVGTFTGTVSIRTALHFDFAPIAGPTYVVRLEQTTAANMHCTLIVAGASGSTSTLSAP